MAVGGIFNFFGGWRPFPAFRNSPFRRYLSNGPCPVPQFALQPQFRPIFRILNFGKIMYYYSNKRRYDPPLVFRFSVLGGFSASGTASGGFFGKFQYRTTVFVASPAPMSRKLGTEDFLLKVWRIPRCSFSRSRLLTIILKNNNIKGIIGEGEREREGKEK